MIFLRSTTPRVWISCTRADICVPRRAIAKTASARSVDTTAGIKYRNANTKPTTSPTDDGNKDHQLSQGHVTDPAQRHLQDPLSQAARSALETRHPSSTSRLEGEADKTSDSPLLDAASPSESGMKAPRSGLSGNKEGVGFVEQVGSASGTEASRSMRAGRQGEGEVKEEARPPGILASLKQMLWIGTSVEDVKQNRGGGEGVTGTGTRMGSVDLASSSSSAPEKVSSQSQYSDSFRKPKKRTHGGQNEHVEPKRPSWDRDSGSGNAVEEPFLPSYLDTNEKDEGRRRGASSEQV
ncbi:hypothetical protein M404DRAFT_168645 [Pisolithus tinctorius Marx 270]|uniref:Uncharacterized protein n=1 Tax=Pisolithus tinctorius Marx 270 TaxID=870435 RepID=A0A0C3J9I9_PISTI|nr:hypothetical protein M404DRAFT_168645 [Pisolithus tinctorius Marx 270]